MVIPTTVLVTASILALAILVSAFYAVYHIARERGYEKARTEETRLTHQDLIAYNNALTHVLNNVEDLLTVIDGLIADAKDASDYDDWDDPYGVQAVQPEGWKGLAHDRS